MVLHLELGIPRLSPRFPVSVPVESHALRLRVSRGHSPQLDTPCVAGNRVRKRVADCKHGFESRWGFEPMPAPDLPCWRREGSPTGLVCNAMGRFIKVSF